MSTLEEICRKQLPDGKLYIEETGTPLWYREMQSSLGRHDYALYNLVMMEFENEIASRIPNA